MTNLSDRVESAVTKIEDSSDIAEKFADASATVEFNTPKGPVKPIGQLQQEADAAIARIAHFTEETWVAGQTYTEKKIYFIHNGIAYNPVVIPYTAGLVDIQADIDAGLFTVLQGLVASDLSDGAFKEVGVKTGQLPSAGSVAIIADTLFSVAQGGGVNNLVDLDVAIGQCVRSLGRMSPGDGDGSDYIVVPAGTGVHDNWNFIDIDDTRQLRLINSVYKIIKSDQVFTVGNGGDFSSLSEALDYLAEYRFPVAKVRLNLLSETFIATSPDVVSHADAERIEIVGEEPAIANISAGSLSSGQPNSIVTLTLDDASGIDVGDWCLFSASSGTGPYCVASGIWQITAKQGEQVSYSIRTWAISPDQITVTSGTVKPLKSVLRYNNCDGLVTRNRLGLLNNVAIIGNSDEYWDSSNVSGTEKGTHGIYAGGLSVLVNSWNTIAQGTASIAIGRNVGVNGFDQQGVVSDQGSSIFCYFIMSSNNKRRGFYAASGKIRNKFAVANGNFLDGAIADYGASIESSGLVCCGNGSAGASSVNGSSMTIPNGFYFANNINVQSKKGGYLELANSRMENAALRDASVEIGSTLTGTACVFNSDTENVRVASGSHATISDSVFNENATTHINAQESTVIFSDCINCTKFSHVNSVLRDNNSYQTFRIPQIIEGLNSASFNNEIRVNDGAGGGYARIAPSSGGDVYFGSSYGNAIAFKKDGGQIWPAVGDSIMTLGRPDYLFSEVFAATSSINVSDESLKTAITGLTEAERAAALEVKAIIGSFKFTDAVSKKGDKARLHIGVGAQSVEAILRKHHLDPFRYSFLCFDEWEAIEEQTDESGNILQFYKGAGSRYAIRYDELLCFIMAAI